MVRHTTVAAAGFTLTSLLYFSCFQITPSCKKDCKSPKTKNKKKHHINSADLARLSSSSSPT